MIPGCHPAHFPGEEGWLNCCFITARLRKRYAAQIRIKVSTQSERKGERTCSRRGGNSPVSKSYAANIRCATLPASSMLDRCIRHGNSKRSVCGTCGRGSSGASSCNIATDCGRAIGGIKITGQECGCDLCIVGTDIRGVSGLTALLQLGCEYRDCDGSQHGR